MDDSSFSLGLARQPIFDKQLRVVAYELLYHSEQEGSIVKLLQGDQDVCSALIRNFTSIFESGSMKTLPAFINVSNDFIRSRALPQLSKQNLVVDLKNEVASPELLASIRSYVDAGYRIVIDNMTYSSALDELLSMADIVRIDVTTASLEAIQQQVQQLKRFKVACLADNVSSQRDYDKYAEIGFLLFQGSFLSQPTMLEGKKLNSNQAIVIHLLAALQDDDVTPNTIADITSRDPVLTFKLLKIVNSAKYNLPNKIENLTQAVVALGLDEVNKWTTLLALSSNDDKPTELIRQILITARMCEFISFQTHEVEHKKAFICGVLCMLDALLEIDQATLLEHIDVSPEIAMAIQGYKGRIGKLLQAVTLYMIGQEQFQPPSDVRELYAKAYYEALRWSNETMQMMEGSHL